MTDFMDDIARANQQHWTKLVGEGQSFTTPWLDLDVEEIHAFARGDIPGDTGPLFQMHPPRLLRDLSDAHVLCLATGGGQQSAVFGLLGATVTVADLTEAQLDGDRRAAIHYGYDVTTIQADMRDLSALTTDSFDLVYQAPSLGWIPDVRAVYREATRVLRPGGAYRLHVGNPANAALEWDGRSYQILEPYDIMEFRQDSGAINFRHHVTDLLGGLIDQGLVIEEIFDHPWGKPDIAAEPGSWSHEMAYNVAMIVVARAMG